MTNPISCPISDQIKAHSSEISALSKAIIRSLRSLRRELQDCEFCPELPNCEIRSALASQIHQALTEITEEIQMSMQLDVA